MRKYNIDSHLDKVEDKTFGSGVGNRSTEYAEYNLDKLAEFIFDDNREKIETKRLGRIINLMHKSKENQKLSAKVYMKEWRLKKFKPTHNDLKKMIRVE